MPLALYDALRATLPGTSSLRGGVRNALKVLMEHTTAEAGEVRLLGESGVPGERLATDEIPPPTPPLVDDAPLALNAFRDNARVHQNGLELLLRIEREPVAVVRLTPAPNLEKNIKDTAWALNLFAEDLFREMAREKIDRNYHLLNRMIASVQSLVLLVREDGVIREIRGNLPGMSEDKHLRDVGTSVESLFPDAPRHLRRALEDGESSFQVHRRDLHRIYHVLCTPFDSPPPDPQSVMLLVTDVTTQINAQQNLRILHEMGREIAKANTLREAAASALPLTCERWPECCVEIWWPSEDDTLVREEQFRAGDAAIQEDILSQFPSLRLPLEGKSFVAETLLRRKSREFRCDARTDAPLSTYLKALHGHGFTTALAVPIPLAEESYLVLVLYLTDAHRDIWNTQKFLETQATELGLFLSRRESELIQREQRERLRALSVRLAEVQDLERKKFSRAVHDSVGHELGMARMQLGGVLRGADSDLSDTTRESLQNVEDMLKEAIRMARNLSTEFSPPILYDAGLFPALRWLADRFTEKYGKTVHVHLEEGAERGVEENVRNMLFNSTRECLNNVVKHADADTVIISAQRPSPDMFLLEIEDNGRGFAPESLQYLNRDEGGFGLFSIREALEHSGGRFVCDSSPNRGTRIAFYVPIPLTPTPEDTSS